MWPLTTVGDSVEEKSISTFVSFEFLSSVMGPAVRTEFACGWIYIR